MPEFSRLEVRPAELPCARKGAKKMLKTDDNKAQGYLSVFGGTAVIYTLASAPKAALVGTDNAGASVADATAPTLLTASQMVTATYQSPQSAGAAPAYVQNSLGLGSELPILGQVLPEDGTAAIPQGVFSSGSVSGDMAGATAGIQAATISAGSAGVTAAFSPAAGGTEFSKAAPSTLLFDTGTQTPAATPSTLTTAALSAAPDLVTAPSVSGATSSDPTASTPSSAASASAPTGQTTTAALTSTPNKIVLENMKQGNPDQRMGSSTGDGDGNIQGFATEISTQCRPDGRLQDRDRLDPLPDRYLPARLLRRRRRPQGGDHRQDSDAPRRSSRIRSSTCRAA